MVSITTFLIYGRDSTGKSSQLKSICEASEEPIVISLEMKNRRLYGLNAMGKMTDESPFEVVEPLVIENPPSFVTMPVETYNSMGKVIERILNNQGPDGKPKKYKTVVIDGISDISRWAEKVTIKGLQEKWERKGKEGDMPVGIGKENLAAWTVRNNLTCMPLERLAAWAEINGANVFFSTLMTPEYLNNAKSGYKMDIQDRIRDKVCDVRVCLSSDGRGYTARFEKVPNWAEKITNKAGAVTVEMAISEGGLFMELARRRLL